MKAESMRHTYQEEGNQEVEAKNVKRITKYNTHVIIPSTPEQKITQPLGTSLGSWHVQGQVLPPLNQLREYSS